MDGSAARPTKRRLRSWPTRFRTKGSERATRRRRCNPQREGERWRPNGCPPSFTAGRTFFQEGVARISESHSVIALWQPAPDRERIGIWRSVRRLTPNRIRDALIPGRLNCRHYDVDRLSVVAVWGRGRGRRFPRSCMIGLSDWHGPAAPLGQHCPQMARRDDGYMGLQPLHRVWETIQQRAIVWWRDRRRERASLAPSAFSRVAPLWL